MLRRKLQTLFGEYQVVQQKFKTVRRALKQEKVVSESLEKQLNEANQSLRTKDSEISTLNFHKDRLTKRCDKVCMYSIIRAS